MPFPIINNPKGTPAENPGVNKTGKAGSGIKSLMTGTLKQSANAIGNVTQHLGKNPQNAPAQNRQQPNASRSHQTGGNNIRHEEPVRSANDRSLTRQNQPQTNAKSNGGQKSNLPFDNKNQNTARQTKTAPESGTKNNNQSTTAGSQNSQKQNGILPVNQTQTNEPQTNKTSNAAPQNDPPNNPVPTSQPENQLNNLVKNTLGQIFRQQGVYLNQNGLDILTSGKEANLQNSNNQVLIPREIARLIESIAGRLLFLADNSNDSNRQIIQRAVSEALTGMPETIQTAKQFLAENPVFEIRKFTDLGIEERLTAAIEIILRILPEEAVVNLESYSSQEILNGFLLARGLLVPQDNAAQIKAFVSLEHSNLTPNFSMTALRDLGQLVKILMIDAGAAKNSTNLDLAVQKFVRILLANYELGILLAAISLANGSETADSSNRTVALAQVYQLISRLMEAGEKAMKQAMPEAVTRNILQKDEKNIFFAPALKVTEEKDGKSPALRNPQNTAAGNSLRQYLEFNPNFIHDKSFSAFVNPDDARRARQDFKNHFQIEIENWLRSGNHRFVKDYDLEKPVGIVVERHHEEFFNASQMRIVLVRDGSTEGWHFLKSFLVR